MTNERCIATGFIYQAFDNAPRQEKDHKNDEGALSTPGTAATDEIQ